MARRPLRGRRVVYLSPHHDDLAAANGGLVRRRPFSALTLVNVFTRSRWTRHAGRRSAAVVSAVRAREDAAFRRRLGVRGLDLGFPDSSCRGYDDLTELHAPASADPILVSVRAAVRSVSRRETADLLLAPLAIGNHVDHLLVHHAARAAGCEVWYWEDLPYAAAYELEYIAWLATRRVGPCRPLLIDVTDVFEAKVRALRAYRSQLTADIAIPLRFHAARLGRSGSRRCERLWRPVLTRS